MGDTLRGSSTAIPRIAAQKLCGFRADFVGFCKVSCDKYRIALFSLQRYKTVCFDDEAFSREKLSYTNIPNDTHLLLLIQCLKTRLQNRTLYFGYATIFDVYWYRRPTSMGKGTGTGAL